MTSYSNRSRRIVRGGEVQQEMLLLHDLPTPSEGAGGRRGLPSLTTAEQLLTAAQEQAASILAAAEARAQALQAEAEAEGLQIAQKAREEGFRRGHEEGTRAAAQEMAALLAPLRDAARSAQQVRERLIADAERELVILALEVASRVLGHRAQADPSLVTEMVQRAMRRVSSENVVRIRVNPGEVERVSAMLYELPEGANWPVEGDDAIALGGCVIDTRAGVVDARLDTQVEKIGEALLALTEGFDD